MPKHYRTTFRGEKPPHEIESAVGREGGMVTRVHVENGETTVYFTGGEGRGRHLREALGAREAEEVSEDEVMKIG